MKHRPRKRFGQNFLRDGNVISKIMAAAELESCSRVVEIGPGQGALTDRMLATGAQVTVIEVDRDLGEALQSRSDENLRVVVGDVLKIDLKPLLPEPPYRLVANLPYNISSQVLFTLLDYRDCFDRLVLMFQKEVGDRLLATPGTKDYGVLSILIQQWFTIKRVVKVPPTAFKPAPKVDSVVLQFDPRPSPMVVVADEQLFRQLVRGAFAQRRKTLRNSLLGSGFSAEAIDAAFAASGFAPTRRGETLSIQEFGCLADHIHHCSKE